MSRLQLACFVAAPILLGGCDRWESSQAHSVPTWSLSPSPVVSKRGVQIGSDSVFFFPIMDATFADNGDIVLALGAGRDRVIYLDSRGELIAPLGRVGAGPGEVRMPLRVFRFREAVAVVDYTNRRISFFREGRFVSAYPLESPIGQQVLGVVGDTVLVTTWVPNPVAQMAPDQFPLEGEPKAYYWWGSEGGEPHQAIAGVELADPSFTVTSQYEGYLSGAQYSMPRCLPQLHFSMRHDTLVVADGQEGVVYTLTRDGDRTEIYRGARSGVVTQELYDSISAMLDRLGRSVRGRLIEASQREALGRLGTVGDSFPSAWSGFVLDDENRYWLQQPSCVRGGKENRWWVADGARTIGVISFPSSFKFLDVKNEMVLGIETDGMGVESIVVYGLSKP